MFALTLKGGMCMSLAPDVCKTPSPSGAPVPVPYCNTFQCAMVTPNTASSKVFIDGAPALTVKSQTSISNGDEPGTVGGVVSGKFIGKGEFISGAQKVKIENTPGVAQGAPTKHNDGNTTGMSSTPSQTKVSIT